ncbi:MAG TPA: hypothetical protein VJR92_15875 [Gemmatimonadaceae bacterium]|nr:hypothetical protein [Gemmatimonadaceae bacterium]
MPRFFIEVPHGASTADCNRAIDTFLRTGSHFLTHADWGCKDGEHKAWFIAELDSKDEARNIVPSPYRHDAKVVQLTVFSLKDMEGLRKTHKG